MENKRYKDQCDECKKFDYCKGVEGKVLCQECAKKHEEENNNDINQCEEN